MQGDAVYIVDENGEKVKNEKTHFAIDVAGVVNAVTACGILIKKSKNNWKIDVEGCAVTCARCVQWMGIEFEEDSELVEITEMDEDETRKHFIDRLVEATQLVLEDLYDEAEENKEKGKIDQDILDQIDYFEEAVNAIQTEELYGDSGD